MKLIVHEVGITLNLTLEELAECLGYVNRDELHDHVGRGVQAIATAIRETWKVDLEVTEDPL